jgi:hypothetical protein
VLQDQGQPGGAVFGLFWYETGQNQPVNNRARIVNQGRSPVLAGLRRFFTPLYTKLTFKSVGYQKKWPA